MLTPKHLRDQPGRLTERLEEEALWWLPKPMRDAWLQMPLARKLGIRWSSRPPSPPGE